MSDSYSKEVLVCNWLRDYLINQQYNIYQLVCPGGQATYSIRFTNPSSNKIKTIFPDLIASKEKVILIGEIKANFSIPDKSKLLALKHSIDGPQKILDLVSRLNKKITYNSQIEFTLIHSDNSVKKDNEITQLVITESTFKCLK
jgi:hypothetical protein